ncbi:MAG: hypothetical protein WCC74_03185 [Minisyncoccia bacterium]
MSIKPICNKCKEELKEFGGILLSPPNNKDEVKKYHLYKKCFEEIESKLKKIIK